MLLRTKKRLIDASIGAMWVLAICVACWGWQDRPSLSVGLPARQKAAARLASSIRSDSPVSLAAFEPFWNRPLRQQLFDPPPPAPPVVEKPPPRPIVAKLLATMIEADQSVAMLQLTNGEIVFRRSGEAIGGEDADVILTEIGPGTAIARRNDQDSKLTIENLTGN